MNGLWMSAATNRMMLLTEVCMFACLQDVLAGVHDAEDRSVLECSLELPILELAATLLSGAHSIQPPSGQPWSMEQQQLRQHRLREAGAKKTKKRGASAKGFGLKAQSAPPSLPPTSGIACLQPALGEATFQGMTLLAINDRRLQMLGQVCQPQLCCLLVLLSCS